MISNKLRNSTSLYWGLIGTFGLLYLCVGFVSTLHSITFFELANTMWLAVLLGVTYEVGQAAVLFSILMSKNNQTMLAWGLMILLTALQVTANVYASFKFMDGSGVNDWQYWQRSILFWMEADPEMFKVVISWISGALLPVVALGMTSLVAENIKLKDDDEVVDEDVDEEGRQALREHKKNYKEEFVFDEKPVDQVIYDTSTSGEKNDVSHNDLADKLKNESLSIHENLVEEGRLQRFKDAMTSGEETPYEKMAGPNADGVIEEKAPIEVLISPSKEDVMANFANTLEYDIESIDVSKSIKLDANIISSDIMAEKVPEIKLDVSNNTVNIQKVDASGNALDEDKPNEKTPSVRGRGWHLKKEYIDSNGDVYSFGVYQPNIKGEIPNTNKDTSKKA